MRFYVIGVYLFLYVPIGIIVLFSFNSGRHASDFQGLSVKWYGKALSNPFVMDALTTSLIIALSAAVLSSVMGTTAALAVPFHWKNSIKSFWKHRMTWAAHRSAPFCR